MKEAERYKKAKIVTLIGAFVNTLLGVLKLIGGMYFNSHALIADGFHSFSDLLTDTMVLLASKYGSQGADHSHPYGHQRIETAATLLLSLVLILAGMGIVWDSFEEIIQGQHDHPNFLAIPIALFSIFANEGLYHYTLAVGKAIKSDLVKANAWHHRSDAASSIVVLLGLIASLLGYVYFDGVAAILVGLMIVKMGWSYGWNSVKELVDTGVDQKMLTKIITTIQEIDGVLKVHQLRNRSMGGEIYVDVHILVSPRISVSEGHFIAQNVEYLLAKKIKEIKDVTVHVDPEDDELICPSQHLPNRSIIETTLLLKWQIRFPMIQNWLLHYLDGSLSIDLFCLSNPKEMTALRKMIDTDIKTRPEIIEIQIFFLEQKTLAKNTP